MRWVGYGVGCCLCGVLFFFKQKTAYEMRISDWSSDVCSSDLPGAFVGEIGALLATARTADVVAAEDSVVRTIGEPEAVFSAHPQLALELARQLAGRLQDRKSVV